MKALVTEPAPRYFFIDALAISPGTFRKGAGMRHLRWASTSHTTVSRSARIRRFLLRVEELENRTLLDAGLMSLLKAAPLAGVLKPAYTAGQSPAGYHPGQVRHAYG